MLLLREVRNRGGSRKSRGQYQACGVRSQAAPLWTQRGDRAGGLLDNTPCASCCKRGSFPTCLCVSETVTAVGAGLHAPRWIPTRAVCGKADPHPENPPWLPNALVRGRDRCRRGSRGRYLLLATEILRIGVSRVWAVKLPEEANAHIPDLKFPSPVTSGS